MEGEKVHLAKRHVTYFENILILAIDFNPMFKQID
jgi:hypothetical protein